MDRTIIHVDMDAFFAAVEVRDNPALKGKPLIIGALPNERGVVSTCSYEARKFGVHSAMSIKEAYRRCPHGTYMHPNGQKYIQASVKIHEIWDSFTDVVEYVSLDEGYLDVTGSAHMYGGARNIAQAIKERTKSETGLTCSVGIGYSMTTAKLASEEKKPDGFFEIQSPDFFINLVIDRSVRVIYGIGSKTADELGQAGIATVRDIRNNRDMVIRLLGKHGQQIVDLADGIDNRKVTPHDTEEAKSIGRECTFQQDITDFEILKDMLRLLAKELSLRIRLEDKYCRTITLKVTYWNMQGITRSASGDVTNKADVIYKTAASMLDKIDRRPIRLVGISLSNFTQTEYRQLTLSDMEHMQTEERKEKLNDALFDLLRRYGCNIIKTGSELSAENRFKTDFETDQDGDKK